MNILYIHQYFCTPAAGGGVRSYEFAKRWVKLGHHVSVITSIGYDESLKPHKTVTIDGIRVTTIGGKYSPYMGFVRRIVSFCFFALHSCGIAAKARHYDVVLATSTPLTVAFPAIIARIFAKRTTVFEVRDVWPDAAIEAGVLKNHLIILLARLLEKLAYRYCDHIVPLSTGMLNRIKNKGIPANKMTVLSNCSDMDRFDPEKYDRCTLRRNFGVADHFVLLYLGAIGLTNDMPFLAKAMEALKGDDRIVWWFVGDGNRLDYLIEKVRCLAVPNVHFFGKVAKSEVTKYVSASDIGIVSFINKPVYYENSPNKFFDYCAGGLPSIFTRTTWLSPYLSHYGAGFVCENNDIEELCKFIRMLRNDPGLCKKMGSNARKLAHKEFSRDVISNRYLSLLKGLSSEKKRSSD